MFNRTLLRRAFAVFISLALTVGLAAMPVRAAQTADMGRIAAGEEYSLYVDSAGDLYIFGRNFAREQGESDQLYYSPTKLDSEVKAVAAGSSHYLYLKKDGSVWAVGQGEYGELGDGRSRQEEMKNGIHRMVEWKDGVPQPTNNVRTQRVLENITAISAGTWHSLALDKDGNVWAAGRNASGELGDGTTTDRTKFVQVKGISNITAISANGDSSMALAKDGTLYCWGLSYSGALVGKSAELTEAGNGTNTIKNYKITEPMKVMGNVRAMSAGGDGSLVVQNDGSMWAWGGTAANMLGDSSIKNTSPPAKVMEDVQAVDMGGGVTMVLKTDGTVWAWGTNTLGQVGTDTNGSKVEKPVKVCDRAVAISVGGNHAIVLKEDGSLWTTGSNRQGQLGNGKVREIPYQTGFKKIM